MMQQEEELLKQSAQLADVTKGLVMKSRVKKQICIVAITSFALFQGCDSSSVPSDEANIVTKSTPVQLSVDTTQKNGILLSWTPVKLANHYRLDIKEGGNVKESYELDIKENSFRDKSVENEKKYTYTLAVYDEDEKIITQKSISARIREYKTHHNDEIEL